MAQPMPNRPMQNWIVRKPVAVSRGGIVASQNGVAAAIGADVLAGGGSAVDAVVATAFALSVREPWNSGLGGIGFMVVQPPGGARAEVVDFGPVAPSGLDPAAYPLTGETRTELFTWPRVEGDRRRPAGRRRRAVGDRPCRMPRPHRAVIGDPLSRLRLAGSAWADRRADPRRCDRPAIEQALSAGAGRGLFRDADRCLAAG